MVRLVGAGVLRGKVVDLKGLWAGGGVEGGGWGRDGLGGKILQEIIAKWDFAIKILWLEEEAR